MRFEVYNRGDVQKINPSVPHAIISIQDPRRRKDFAGVAQNEFTVEVLEVDFHDVNHSKYGNVITPINEQHAEAIVDFYLRNKDRVELFIAHCDAGASRSPGVLAALEKLHTGDDFRWFKSSTPNTFVYRSILNVAANKSLL